ncbi:MAG: hypothetical protein PHY40_02105 [Patescibacteria group bacterium]|nr:hypothetical protein [Patescibacteria group bacterium]
MLFYIYGMPSVFRIYLYKREVGFNVARYVYNIYTARDIDGSVFLYYCLYSGSLKIRKLNAEIIRKEERDVN